MTARRFGGTAAQIANTLKLTAESSDTYTSKRVRRRRTHQYDMYKRFIRWASDRLDDAGIIAFITNRAYIDSLQDDGFRQNHSR